MYEIICVLIVFLIISMIMVITYTIYMGNKNNRYPTMNFDKFSKDEYNIEEFEHMINKTIQGVKGWMWLATLFTALYYFFNFGLLYLW